MNRILSDKNKIVPIVLFMAVIFFMLFVFQASHRVLDDAYITYRFAENFAAGKGFVWNHRGVETEGFTSLFHVLLLAVFKKFGFDDLLLATRLVSMLCIVLSSYLCYRLSLRLNKNKILASFVVFLILGNGLYIYAGLFGLETIIYSGLLTITSIYWWKWHEFGSAKYAFCFSIAALLSALTRPDFIAWLGILFTSYFLLLLIRDPFSIRQIRHISVFVLGVALCLLILVYTYVKYVYFGNHMPNPFYIKSSGALISISGLKYVLQFIAWAIPLVIGCIYDVLKNKRAISSTSLSITAILFILVYIKFDPLMGTAFRFLLPTWPILALFGIHGIDQFISNKRESKLGGIDISKIILALSFVWCMAWLGATYLHIERTNKDRNTINYTAIGLALAKIPKASSYSVVSGDQGALPFFSGWESIDLVGLTDAEIAIWQNKGDIESIVLYIKNKNPDLLLFRKSKHGYWYISHSRITNLAQRFIADQSFIQRYEQVGFIRDQANDDIVFFLRRDNAEFGLIKRTLEKVVRTK